MTQLPDYQLTTIFLVLILFCQLLKGQLGPGADEYRSRRTLSSKRAFLDGDYIIGGIFPVHTGRNENNTACTEFNPKGMSWVLAMIYAVEEINKNGTFFPGVKLGYDIRDGCNQVDRAIEASLDFSLGPSHPSLTSTGYILPDGLNGGRYTSSSSKPCCDAEVATHDKSKVVGVVGSASSRISMAVATVFGSMSIPQISYSSTSRLLSDKTKYRSFLRTIPSDVLQVQALADIVASFNWQYISTVASDDIYGKIGIESLKQEIKNRGICIAVSSVFSKSSKDATLQDMERIIRRLKNTDAGRKAKVIVLFCSNHEAVSFLEEAERQGLTGKTWIASESWGDEAAVLNIDHNVVLGTIGLLPESGNTDGYNQYIHNLSLNELIRKHPWIDEIMMTDYNCSLNGYDPSNNRVEREANIDSSVVLALNATGIPTTDPTPPRLPSEFVRCSHLLDYNLNPASATNKNGTFLPLGKTPYVIDAVTALALALNPVICPNGVCRKNLTINEYDFLRSVRNVKFQGLQGQMKFDENGDPSGSYRLNNIQRTRDGKSLMYVDVGGWDGRRKERLILNREKIVWSDGSNNIPVSVCSLPCRPGNRAIYGSTKCCWTCVTCERGEISNVSNSGVCMDCPLGETNNSDHTECVEMPLEFLRWDDVAAIFAMVLSFLFFLITLFVLAVFIKYRDTPVVKGSNRNLSYVLLTAIALCYVLPFLYIGIPTDLSCAVQPVYFGFVFTLCVAIMLTKTQRLLTVFYARFSALVRSRSSRFKHEHKQAAFVTGLTLIALIIGVTCSLILTPEAVRDYSFPDIVVIRCGSDWFAVQLISMSYVAFLSIVCSFLAFKARKLPENFNEAKHLSFSMFMLCLVWIVCLPAYFGSHGKSRTSIMCFAAIFAALFILGFMFFPKIRIILFQAEKNDPNYVREQTIQHTMGTDVGTNIGGDSRKVSNASTMRVNQMSAGTPRPSPKPSPRGRELAFEGSRERADSAEPRMQTKYSQGSPKLDPLDCASRPRRNSDGSAKSAVSTCSSVTNLCVVHGKEEKQNTKAVEAVVCTKL
ncbi:metabotropic glutamate receptor 3-like isoform X2 [Lineus longissimus]|uniref:metabotropic glutamate receptor 3-like isoform X2 n=1 Tax=Lineus longissimus TaxID=88925 RepID=UPI00315CFB6C